MDSKANRAAEVHDTCTRDAWDLHLHAGGCQHRAAGQGASKTECWQAATAQTFGGMWGACAVFDADAGRLIRLLDIVDRCGFAFLMSIRGGLLVRMVLFSPDARRWLVLDERN